MKRPISRAAALVLCAVTAVSAVSCGSRSSDSSSQQTSVASSTQQASESSADETDEDSKAQEVIDLYDTPEIDFEGDGTAQVKVDGTRFTVSDKELWINGVNTPWNKWNDFGSKNFTYAFWETHFAELEEAGVNASRVWINCDDMVGVILNEDGSFKEVTDKHWQDLDVLFSIAKKHHIYIMATLLSFDHFKDSNNAYQNWRNMVQSSDNIDSFVQGYIVPFVQRYDSCDYLWSIDLMNEPDWVYEQPECGNISWDDLCNYFARGAAAIHENSNVLVTVGFGIIKYNSDLYEGNKGSDDLLLNLNGDGWSYLDFYSTHYYIWQFQYFKYPFKGGPEYFGLDGTKPCVIGEVAANDFDDSGQLLEQKYEDALNSGWNGVMAWSSNGVDECGSMKDIAPAIAKVAELADDKVHPLK